MVIKQAALIMLYLVRVWLIGDSTMADKEIKAYPETGWGMPFAHFFDTTVVVDNRAKNGRSTKSFIAEGRWEAVVQALKPGDYALIQFGHNDEVPTKANYTPPDQFEANLIRFIKDARDKQAIPVLITPVARRKFDSAGNIQETHAEYADIVRKVAAAQNTPLIDLDKESQTLLQQLGPDKSKLLFNYLAPHENPHYPEGREDDTHFNELGARKMAEIVLADIRNLKLALADHIAAPLTPAKPKTLTVASDGSGKYRTVQAALNAATPNTTIYIKAGTYHEKLQLDSTKTHLTLIGDDAKTTILTYDDHPGMVAPNGDSINTRNSYSFRVLADDFTARNITFRNDAGFTAGQAVGLESNGDRAVFVNCRIIGNQDILFLNSDKSRQYYDNCYIEGTTDFIFGSATAWFEHCTIHSKKNSHVTAASTPQEHPYGFVFDHCTLTGDSTLDRVSLGRPWRPYASVMYMHCWLGGHILSDGWANWNKTENYKTTRYAEYDNEGPGARPASRVAWSRQLPASEAQQITPHTIFGDWDPADAAPTQAYSWSNLPLIHQPAFKKDTFNIINYDAVADGITVNTRSIQSTIDVCGDKGGGVVLIPSGLWITGPIVMRSGVNLHLDRAAILQFSADKDLYPIVAGNWEGHPAARCQSPITGTDLENIAITGGGIIDGNGDSWRWIAKDRLSESEWKQKVASGGVVTEDGKKWFAAPDKRDSLRPNLLVLNNCKKILLDGPTFQNSPAWCLHTLLCEDLTVTDVHVRNPWYAVNGDGIDVESCKGVLIEKSTFDAGDDGICVKSGRDEAGRKRGRPTENMIVREDIVYRAHGGFVIGSEMSGGARNIFVSHCSFIGTDIGIRLKTVRGRGGLVEKIFIKDIAMRNIVHQAVFLDMYYFSKAPSIADIYSGVARADTASVSEATPRFRDIHITNIVCDGAEEGIFVRGLPEMNIRDIDLSDMVLKAAKGAEIIEAQHIGLRNIRLVTSDSTPVVYIENSSDLQFENMHYNTGARLLFSINGAKCANIRVSDTDVSKAVHNAAFNYGAGKDSFKND